jgi:curved DNA-binding protein CbpA
VKTHYELLDVGQGAAADEIKKAFRREIARYHPDKVQHLGPEFQEIAAGRAADLTEAYRVLMDEALRAEYDARLKSGVLAGAPSRRADQPPVQQPSEDRASQAAPAASAATPPAADRVPSDFVRKAGTSRLRDAVAAVSGGAEPTSVSGFDAAYDIKGKAGLFKKSAQPVRLLVKFVSQVDPEAIARSWVDAVRSTSPDYVRVLLLLGAGGMAPTKELSAAITEQRRKTRGPAPVVVPVDVRDWEALFPPETPDTVRAIMQRLREGAA